MNRRWLAIAFIFLGSGVLYGQTVQQGFTVDPYIPKTPGVAAMEKFLDSPVSLHTGTHELSIPVFEISMKNFKLPIALKYNSSGIKVEEFATDVGLGWSLQAGGAVSSTVHGIPDTNWSDEFQRIQGVGSPINLSFLGFPSPASSYEAENDHLESYTGTDLAFVKGVLRGLRDSEPDLYFFSTPTISGKFFKQQYDYRPVPHQQVKIQGASSSYAYTITDESGNVFNFGTREKSVTSTTNPCSAQGHAPYAPNNTQYTYQLTSIVTAMDEVINFEYEQYQYSITNQTQWSRQGPAPSADFDCIQIYTPFVTGERCPSYGTTEFQEAQRLKRITTFGLTVDFIYSTGDRTDLPGVKALKGIKVTNKLGEVLKDFVLEQSYFNASLATSDPNAFRLKLLSAGEVGKPKYVFEYDESNPVPNRLSLSQDEFGYFNNRPNTTLLPKEEHYGFDTGADRQSDFEFAKVGIITRVTYPTKGTLSFEYEPHSYYTTGVNDIVYTPTTSSQVASVAGQTISTTFTLGNPSLRPRIFYNNSDDGLTTHNDECNIVLSGPNGFTQEFYGQGPPFGYLLSLAPGNYTLSIETIGTTFSGNAYVTWVAQTSPANERTAAGLRIKRIENCALPGSGCVSKTYSYVKDDGTSSGKAFFKPVFTYQMTQYYKDQSTTTCGGDACKSHACNLYMQSSNSVLPLTSNKGTNIAYSQVTVFDADNIQLGKTVHKFQICNADSPVNIGAQPFGPVITFDWLNGIPLEVTQYEIKNDTPRKVKRQINTYNYSCEPTSGSLQSKVKGMKIALPLYPIGCSVPCEGIYNMPTILFSSASYELISSWHYLTQTDESTFMPDGRELKVTTVYERDPIHNQLSTVSKTESDGTKTKIYQRYPSDYLLTTNPVISKMISLNMINTVLEQHVETISPTGQRKVIGANLTLFKKNTNDRPIPDKFLQLNIHQPISPTKYFVYDGSKYDSSYLTQAQFEKYDVRHNPVQFSDRSGIKHALIWEIGTSSLIAHAVNAVDSSIAYTSFEHDYDGGWSVGSLSRVTTDSYTGKRAFALNDGEVKKENLSTTTKYILTFWSRSWPPGGTVAVTASSAVLKSTRAGLNGWTFYEYVISNSVSVKLHVGGLVDEVRLYPATATMTTYTHEPGLGMTSTSDQNGMVSYYVYDDLDRLKFILDDRKNVLKKYSYNYKQ